MRVDVNAKNLAGDPAVETFDYAIALQQGVGDHHLFPTAHTNNACVASTLSTPADGTLCRKLTVKPLDQRAHVT